MNLVPDTLAVSTKDWRAARELLGASNIVAAGTAGTVTVLPNLNGFNGMFNLVHLPGLTAGYWALFCLQDVIKPFLFQDRTAPEFTALTDPNSEFVFKTDKFAFGARRRCNVGFGLWQLAYGSTGTG
jgi:hypothetical protein